MNVNSYIINNNNQNIDFISVQLDNNKRIVQNGFENKIVLNSKVVVEKNKNVKNAENDVIKIIIDEFLKIAV